jgi:hypothetical protein
MPDMPPVQTVKEFEPPTTEPPPVPEPEVKGVITDAQQYG